MRAPSILCSIAAALAILTAGSAFAQPMPQPTEFHQQLAREVGAWNATAKVWMEPGAEPIESTGKEICTMLGGFWLTSKYEGEFFGQPFTGYGATGYDAESGEYVSTWIDSMTPDLFTSRGTYDVKTHTLTLLGKGLCSQTGKLEEMKLTVEYKDQDHKLMSMFHKVDDGWVRSMEIAYERAE